MPHQIKKNHKTRNSKSTVYTDTPEYETRKRLEEEKEKTVNEK